MNKTRNVHAFFAPQWINIIVSLWRQISLFMSDYIDSVCGTQASFRVHSLPMIIDPDLPIGDICQKAQQLFKHLYFHFQYAVLF